MATEFQDVERDVVELIEATLAEYHPNLKECGVIVGALFANNPDGAAIKVNGNEVLGSIKIVSKRDRVKKAIDAEIVLSQRDWEDKLTNDQRVSLIDNLLSRISRVPSTPKQILAGELPWRLDDKARPKLRKVRGDILGDGFTECIKRHADNAIEFISLEQAMLLANAAKHAGEREDTGDTAVTETEEAA